MHAFRSLGIWLTFLGLPLLAVAQDSPYPEEHFDSLKSYLAIASNRILGLDMIEAERAALIDAANAQDRTQIRGFGYGAAIAEDREDGTRSSRTRATWEISGERTLFRFAEGTAARRSLGALDGDRALLDASRDAGDWLLRIRLLYFDLIATTDALERYESALPVLSERLEAMRALEASGRVAALDLAEIELAVWKIEGELQLTRQRSHSLLADLGNFTGLNEIAGPAVSDLIAFREGFYEEPAAESRISADPQRLRQLDTEVDRSNALAQIAESDRWPRLVARTRFFQDELQGPEFDGTVSRSNAEFLLGLEWKIWDSGESESRARAYRLRARRQEAARTRLFAEHQHRVRSLKMALDTQRFAAAAAEREAKLRQRQLIAAQEAASIDTAQLKTAILAQVAATDTQVRTAQARAAAWQALTHWALTHYGEPLTR